MPPQPPLDDDEEMRPEEPPVRELAVAPPVTREKPVQSSAPPRSWRQRLLETNRVYVALVAMAFILVLSFVIIYLAIILPASGGGGSPAPVDGAGDSPKKSPSSSTSTDVPSSGGGGGSSGVMSAGLYTCVGAVASDGSWRGDDDADYEAGCSKMGGFWDSIVDWFRTERRFLLVMPPEPQQPAPLVLLAPGTGRSPKDQLEISELQALSEEHGFAVVVLEGKDDALNVAKDAWPGEGWDDVSYTYALVRRVHALLPGGVDPRRVFCTGHSRGARFCSMLGARLSPLIAAIAPVGGLRFPLPNDGLRPVPVISFHGLDDETNPYAGGGREYWGTGVPDAVQKWAVFNGCNETAMTYYDNGVALEARTECADDAEVHSYTISGGGHTWPGSPWSFGFLEGAEMPAPAATLLAWRFFEEHPLPPDYVEAAARLVVG